MKKIRLLYILPEVDGGGVGSVAYNYIKSMQLNDFDIDLIVFDTGKEQLWHKDIVNIGIKIYYVKPRSGNLWRHFREVNRIIKNGEYDIVHAHMSEWSVLYCFFAWRNSVKVRIGHSHIAGSLYGKSKQLLLKGINTIFKPFCNYYFACGVKAAEYLWGEKNVKNSKVYIMNNAVSPKKFGFDNDVAIRLKKQYNIDGKLIFGHVGRFDEQKNHMFLIEMFNAINKLCNNAILILIGDGELKEEIEQKINMLNLQKNVILLGKRQDVNKWLNVFDLLLLPSLYEGLPVVAIEAQMNGLPVMASNGVTVEVEILHNSCRLSLDDSLELWAHKSVELALSEKNRNEARLVMKKRGYDIYNEVVKLEQFYKQTLKYNY